MRRADKRKSNKNIHHNNKMKTCFNCETIMEKKSRVLPDGMPFEYYFCSQCGDEILDMKQLHELAELYRKRKQNIAKLSTWGSSLGLRIPKELVQKYKLKPNNEVTFVPEEGSIKILV